jgi:hypothetical protein
MQIRIKYRAHSRCVATSFNRENTFPLCFILEIILAVPKLWVKMSLKGCARKSLWHNLKYYLKRLPSRDEDNDEKRQSR